MVDVADDREILSVLDSGVSLYQALRSLPRERHWVHEAAVTIYSDEQCLQEIPGAMGVIIKTASPGDQNAEYRIFPSTRDSFQEGERVSWEVESRQGVAWTRGIETQIPKK